MLLCKDGIPIFNTSNSEVLRQVYPGELLHFPVVAAGQGEETTPAVIRAFFNDTNGIVSLAQFQDTQKVKKNCTELYYQVHSSATNYSQTLVLYADGPCSTNGRLLGIPLEFLHCTPGFSLNSSGNTCGCEPRLQKYTTKCNITRRAITREGVFWVGYDNHSQVLILQQYCPFNYCKLATDHIIFNLGVFAVATYYVKLAVVPVSQAVVAYISVSVVFATFIGVVLLNAYQQVQPKLQQIIQRLHRCDERDNDNNSTDDEVDLEHEAQPLVAPTVSVIEHPSPQPLLFNELRESLNLINTNDL